MIDFELVKKAECKCGAYWCGSASDIQIKRLENKLLVKFPQSYILFLCKYGEGGISGMYINRINDEEYSSAYVETDIYRKNYNINLKWVVVASIKDDYEEYLVCLDTTEIIDGECSVIKYDLNTNKSTIIDGEFSDYFNSEVKRLLEK